MLGVPRSLQLANIHPSTWAGPSWLQTSWNRTAAVVRSHRSRTPTTGKAIRQQAGSAARSSGHQEEMPSPCLGLCTQEQAAGPTRVPDDVVQHHQPLELQQQLPVGVLGERLGLKASQPVVGVLVAFHKELEGAHLR